MYLIGNIVTLFEVCYIDHIGKIWKYKSGGATYEKKQGAILRMFVRWCDR